MKFAGVCLETANVPRLAEFYSKVFCVEAEGDDVHSSLQVGEAGLAIYHPEGLEQRTKNTGENRFILMFEVNDVDLEYERLKELSIKFVQLPTTHPWGTRALWFNDPDGNRIDFFTVLAK